MKILLKLLSLIEKKSSAWLLLTSLIYLRMSYKQHLFRIHMRGVNIFLKHTD